MDRQKKKRKEKKLGIVDKTFVMFLHLNYNFLLNHTHAELWDELIA